MADYCFNLQVCQAIRLLLFHFRLSEVATKHTLTLDLKIFKTKQVLDFLAAPISSYGTFPQLPPELSHLQVLYPATLFASRPAASQVPDVPVNEEQPRNPYLITIPYDTITISDDDQAVTQQESSARIEVNVDTSDVEEESTGDLRKHHEDTLANCETSVRPLCSTKPIESTVQSEPTAHFGEPVSKKRQRVKTTKSVRR